MKWHLQVQFEHQTNFQLIALKEHPILSLGSCFSEEMGSKLAYYKFNIQNNPFGILYNPKSIAKALNRIVDGKTYTTDDLVERNGIFLSFDYHGSYSGGNANEVVAKINNDLLVAHEQLNTAKTIIITFGTIFYYLKNGEVVSNCHKFPASEFEYRQLTSEEIVATFKSLINRIETINPSLQWIFTVSPIRHWKNGAVNNNLSKSTLIHAVHQLKQEIKQVHYFPSYEIMMDELRDYRFYKSDLLHPTEQAIEYIWSKFRSSSIVESDFAYMKKIDALQKAIQHRPINNQSIEYKRFVTSNLEQLEKLQSELSFIDFSSERNILESALSNSE